METINNTVGKDGVNASADVQTIQKLLKKRGFKSLQTNGTYDLNTQKAIITFQSHFYNSPNGLVSPLTRTLEYLNTGAKPPSKSTKSNSSPAMDFMDPNLNPLPNVPKVALSYCSQFLIRQGKLQNPRNMSPSQKIIDFTKIYEGFVAKPYWDQNRKAPVANFKSYGGKELGYITVGYGHKIESAAELELYKNGITEAQASILFAKDQKPRVNALRNYIKVDVTQEEFDASFSITFNMGIEGFHQSKMLKIINGEITDNLEKEWMKIIYSSGKLLDGLGFRRQSELNILCKGIYKRIDRNSLKGGVPPFPTLTPFFWKTPEEEPLPEQEFKLIK